MLTDAREEEDHWANRAHPDGRFANERKSAPALVVLLVWNETRHLATTRLKRVRGSSSWSKAAVSDAVRRAPPSTR
jgi:hypothetical protein